MSCAQDKKINKESIMKEKVQEAIREKEHIENKLIEAIDHMNGGVEVPIVKTMTAEELIKRIAKAVDEKHVHMDKVRVDKAVNDYYNLRTDEALCELLLAVSTYWIAYFPREAAAYLYGRFVKNKAEGVLKVNDNAPFPWQTFRKKYTMPYKRSMFAAARDENKSAFIKAKAEFLSIISRYPTLKY